MPSQQRRHAAPWRLPIGRWPARSFADYGFEYSEEEQEGEDVDIENQYYNSKGEAPEAGGDQPAGRRTGRVARRAGRHRGLSLPPTPRAERQEELAA